jgi:hypothetical protein
MTQSAAKATVVSPSVANKSASLDVPMTNVRKNSNVSILALPPGNSASPMRTVWQNPFVRAFRVRGATNVAKTQDAANLVVKVPIAPWDGSAKSKVPRTSAKQRPTVVPKPVQTTKFAINKNAFVSPIVGAQDAPTPTNNATV